jgi:hypothetical protein
MGPDFFFTTSNCGAVVWKDLVARREFEGVRNLSFEDARRRSEQLAQIEEVILTNKYASIASLLDEGRESR